ncbi:MAG: hypothetical protein AVDCRST_MAG33-732, partial [uncultured Thermomicrobiales bacterium]
WVAGGRSDWTLVSSSSRWPMMRMHRRCSRSIQAAAGD